MLPAALCRSCQVGAVNFEYRGSFAVTSWVETNSVNTSCSETVTVKAVIQYEKVRKMAAEGGERSEEGVVKYVATTSSTLPVPY